MEITSRLARLAKGNPGDAAPIGDGLSEMRVHWGPGYRIYYLQHGEGLAVVLRGGDKSTQAKDIEAARTLARRWKEEDDGD